MKTVAVVPIKMNNERLPGKNTKCFDNGEPLIKYVLSSLSKVKMKFMCFAVMKQYVSISRRMLNT